MKNKKPALIGQIILAFIFGVIFAPLSNGLKWLIFFYILNGIWYRYSNYSLLSCAIILFFAFIGWIIGRKIANMPIE